MTLRLREKWLWDFWHVWHGDECHLFYLQAPRTLGREELRHHEATIGHAFSRDLRHWTVVTDALHPGAEGDWDDLATWTGSVVRHDSLWYMLYTGVRRSERGLIQRVGVATSPDLYEWKKDPRNPILQADPRWYEILDLANWYEQAWRDPWLFRDPDDGSFHALVTARVPFGEPDGRGVIGHARSRNLLDWQVLPPITASGGFGHLEVPQLVRFEGRYLLVFSCQRYHIARYRIARLGDPPKTGTFCVAANNALGPFDLSEVSLLVGDTDGSYYSGKLIEDSSGRLQFMAFNLYGSDGAFVGELTDAFPVRADGRRMPWVDLRSGGSVPKRRSS